jgi:hypothetical protein
VKQAEPSEQPAEASAEMMPGTSDDKARALGPHFEPQRSSAGVEPCPACGTVGTNLLPSYVYALGRIEPRFPRLSVEKEFAQAAGRAETASLTDRQVMQRVLADNRYLVKQLCWVMTISGVETYILVPRDPVDFNLLVETLRTNPDPGDLDLVIGLRGPAAPPEMCNGLTAGIVFFDQIYSFERDVLLRAIPNPEKVPADRFRASAEEVFDRIMQLTDNSGVADEHRALNYLAMRYPAIYTLAAEQFAHDFSLSGVEARSSVLSGTRTIIEAIFSYTNRNTDFTHKFFVRVDVTEEFPFLVRKLSPYYDR